MSHYDKIWWLEEGVIGGMRQPEVEDIPELYEKGLHAIASFLTQPENLDEYKENNIDFCWIPVEDDKAPTREQVEEFSAFADRMKEEGKALAVHCKGGNGRAGTMLAGHFILKGRPVEDILTWMRSINPKAVSTQTQEEFLKSL